MPIGRLRIRQPGNVGSAREPARRAIAVLAEGVQHEPESAEAWVAVNSVRSRRIRLQATLADLATVRVRGSLSRWAPGWTTWSASGWATWNTSMVTGPGMPSPNQGGCTGGSRLWLPDRRLVFQ